MCVISELRISFILCVNSKDDVDSKAHSLIIRLMHIAMRSNGFSINFNLKFKEWKNSSNLTLSSINSLQQGESCTTRTKNSNNETKQ